MDSSRRITRVAADGADRAGRFWIQGRRSVIEIHVTQILESEYSSGSEENRIAVEVRAVATECGAVHADGESENGDKPALSNSHQQASQKQPNLNRAVLSSPPNRCKAEPARGRTSSADAVRSPERSGVGNDAVAPTPHCPSMAV